MWRHCIVPAAIAASAAFASTAAAAPLVTSDPPIHPGFSNTIPDYTVRCRRDVAVHIAVQAPAGTRVAIGDGQPRTGSYDSDVALAPGQAVVIRVITGSSTRAHYVRCLPPDFPPFVARRDGTPTAQWYVVTPSHKSIAFGYLSVFDANGVPVWWMRGDPPAFNGELLPNGHLAWTRWVFGREPLGHYEELRLDGSVARTYDTSPAGANAHELRVLRNGNYLMVRYVPRDNVDLRPWGGPRRATVLDAEVQELEPNGTVRWDWSSAGHVALAETARWYPKLFENGPVDIGGGRSAYDIAHLNSIDVYGDRVVVSLRHTDAVYGIDRGTGAIAWKLGGTQTSRSVRILGDPFAGEDFGGQHDARILDAGKTITVHDNGTGRDRRPRALAFGLDEANRTATLTDEVEFGPATVSKSSGSARRLADGHWVVSWGNIPYVTELTATGRPVLTIHFASPLFSYRAYPVLPGRLSRAALRRGMDAM